MATLKLSAVCADVDAAVDAMSKDPKAGVGELILRCLGKVGGPVADDLRSVLDVDAVGLLAAGWSKASELKAYADPEAYPAGVTVRMALAAHTVQIDLEPELTLTIDGASVERLPLVLVFAVKVEAAVLTLRAGAITAVELGTLLFEGSLKWGRTVLPLKLDSPKLAAPGRFVLDPAVPIPRLGRPHAG